MLLASSRKGLLDKVHRRHELRLDDVFTLSTRAREFLEDDGTHVWEFPEERNPRVGKCLNDIPKLCPRNLDVLHRREKLVKCTSHHSIVELLFSLKMIQERRPGNPSVLCNILEPGGTLVIASACSEGMGSAEYVSSQRNLLDMGAEFFLKNIFFVICRWMYEGNHFLF